MASKIGSKKAGVGFVILRKIWTADQVKHEAENICKVNVAIHFGNMGKLMTTQTLRRSIDVMHGNAVVSRRVNLDYLRITEASV